ncbi:MULTISPECIES: amidase [unclassified Mycolicibacterium]|uniref:amidase n=1 Tax=unclassified Mycolicibacterium TaxID=2636767 RepID=UPI0012DEF3B5|nr:MULTISPECIES: amidase [unclassified Mycolicibacterium]MUL81198.1 amidase [Mycolicibacterium sp. CBMA 329]MUL86964.1 amidase [Mycolicibacterium sp. CBMA 331]MUL98752.1 amidase [Mycolicibacterium sp. CBMA 334]MUM25613.1 amidase [Mycolicibacterium sp. CBMA 295]MUM37261.1 amidase [Mycolicibacterium sp. CBMA 247]
MNDLAFRSAGELATAIATKEVSSVELLDHYLTRVSHFDPQVNSIVALDEESAKAAAREADRKVARGESLGPLHGVPVTIKDSLEVAGMRTTGGSHRWGHHVSTIDAEAVTRLKKAGAIVFGKSNLPADARDWQTYNEVYGTTNNPWDATRGPGGSSGGSAAALAAGLTGLELGGDTAGSIRVPSHFCGVYGLRPSYGIVPRHGSVSGHAPGSLAEFDMAVLGPLGRHADDLNLGLDVIAGPDRDNAPAWRLDLPPSRARNLREFRVAAWLDDPFCPVDRELVAAMETMLAAVRSEGATVVEREGPVGLEETMTLYLPLLMAQSGLIEPDASYAALVEHAIAEGAAAGSASELTVRFRDWHALDERRQQSRRRWAKFFGDVDVLLCPVSPTAAFPHDHRPDPGWSVRTLRIDDRQRPYREMLTWVAPASLNHLPAAVAPIGATRDGLPIGVQVIAPYLHDRTAIRFVQCLAETVGGFRRPPGF